MVEGNLLENDRKRYADDVTVQELVRLRVENERLREALQKIANAVQSDWFGMRDTARAALQQKGQCVMDIVERLRREEDALDNEAADEIERLREQERKMTNHALERMEEIERLRGALKDIENMPIVYVSENIYKQIAREALQQKESE